MNTTKTKKKMENEGRIVELLAEVLINQNETRKEIQAIKKDTAGLKQDMRKANLKLQELSLSVIRLAGLADEQAKWNVRIEDRFEKLEDRFEKLGGRFEKLGGRFEKLGDRFEKLEDRLQRLEVWSERVENRFQRQDERLVRNEARIFKLEMA